MKTISLIIPCLNEAEQLPTTLGALASELPQNYAFEWFFVDDGSTDGTWALLQAEAPKYPQLRALRFSRNFGKEAALAAAFRRISGDAAIVLDCDLQFPLRYLPTMLALWEEGAEVVHGFKKARQKESLGSRLNAAVFYRLFKLTSGYDLKDASDFKLLDRKAYRSLTALNEQDSFFRAMAHWVGFKQARFEFEVDDRNFGQSKWSLKSLLKLSTDALTGFSAKPLLIVAGLGLILEFAFLILAIQTLIHWLRGTAADGFTTVILLQLLIGGSILLSLGLIGLYVARLFMAAKGRPRYLLSESIGLADEVEHER